ncbi:MAG: ribosome maturation factor RimM [Kangiellaceae bacterium]|nr:ribosome maturation factor RimM [Kangiellaceae bacterium]
MTEVSKADFEPIVIGKINGASGIKGWVKVFSNTDPRENILNYKPWFLKLNGQWQEVTITNGREQGKTIVAHIKGVDERNLAETYIGAEIAINKSQLPVLDEGDYYWSDLIGLKVVNLSEQELGQVKKLMETGANDVLVVKTASKEELLIPYVLDYSIIKVDLTAGQITVDWELDY